MNRLYLEIDGLYRRLAKVDIVGKLGVIRGVVDLIVHSQGFVNE